MKTTTAMSKQGKRGKWPLIANIASICMLIMATWLSLTLITIGMYNGDLNKSSQLGDTYGVSNSLFSGLAFGGIIITIWLQSNELRLQRRELRMQRQESRRQREQMEKSAIAQEKAERALNMQADSLLLSAYLHALSSAMESYARGENDYAAVRESEIRQALDSIAEQLAPNISYIAGRTVRQSKSDYDPSDRERERRLSVANKIAGIARRFSTVWNAKIDERRIIITDAAFQTLLNLRKELEAIASEIPREFESYVVEPLRTVEQLLDKTGDRGMQAAPEVPIEGAKLVASVELIASLIRDSLSTNKT